jgi:hypothetical protein
MNGATKETCAKLSAAIRHERGDEAASLAIDLVCGFLVNVARIAVALEKLAQLESPEVINNEPRPTYPPR